ncbi:NAD(P)-dependent oxidoreductase [Mesonia aestuariivivens]|uniref:NAD(P)-dependent oxidoreductase n=1 Tax=Mesonia aestuariivivens TaxID=2796128 RepID=A0ABS6VZ49_9FLAO|nr:NAD(P)-dependent oxidoreductase [Mesonia aestuariivivens]MBW2960878.1 NAD(P)-dependent oxidoreductase [Mesonia aestuariivivens]
MKIGIISERKIPADRRVVFSPTKLKQLQQRYPEAQIKVETSSIRVFPDKDYQKLGFEVTKDLSDCDVLLGVKEVPISALIPNKKYFFFSHTIKKQSYNRELLQSILEKNIELFDHETITDSNGNRLIGFGRYAGIVGAYNGFRAFGLREKTFQLKKVEDLQDYKSVIKELKKVKLPNLKIVLSGNGKVAHGAREILEHLNLKEVNVKDYLVNDFKEAVFCQIDVLDYNKRKDGKNLDRYDFYNNPDEYESDFMRFAKVSDVFMAGHFYGDGAPSLFTKEDAKQTEFKINLVADISCDIEGPIASTLRPSTIAEPFYGYDPQTEKEVKFNDSKAITVMAVDNLPCELPHDASEGFGEMFLEKVIPAFFNEDEDGILERARMTFQGKLTPRFKYLQDYIEGKE